MKVSFYIGLLAATATAITLSDIDRSDGESVDFSQATTESQMTGT